MSKGSEKREATPADLVEQQALNFESSIRRRSGDVLLADVLLRRADGRIVEYDLTIDASATEVKARETIPTRLPASCPERHINPNSTFCTNWQEADPVRVTCSASARRWWSVLLGFLRLQERVPGLSRWPGRRTWAHGSAARHQQEAERCAAALGPEFEEALNSQQLTVRRRSRRVDRNGNKTAFLRLRDGDRRLYSVWERERRVATLKQRCVCGRSRLPLKACGDHASVAAKLVLALRDWEIEEAKFWERYKQQKCCGSIENCPLAANGIREPDETTRAVA